MLIVTHPAPNRLDIELSAMLDADMMRAGLDDLFEKSQAITDGLLMYKIPSFSMPTGGALVVEMMRLPQMFEMIRHFKRCAVVTDIAWLRTAAEFEGAMIPQLEIKGFAMDDLDAAESWLTRSTAKEDEDDEPNVPV